MVVLFVCRTYLNLILDKSSHYMDILFQNVDPITELTTLLNTK